MRREELIARIDIHVAAKNDAPWMSGLVTGTTNKDTEAMQLLKAILPEKIIAKIQVGSICRQANRLIYSAMNCTVAAGLSGCKGEKALGEYD